MSAPAWFALGLYLGLNAALVVMYWNDTGWHRTDRSTNGGRIVTAMLLLLVGSAACAAVLGYFWLTDRVEEARR